MCDMTSKILKCKIEHWRIIVKEYPCKLLTFDTLIFQSCKEKNIKFTVDAEQTYIQAALAYFVLTLQYKYNAEIPMVYNTYQCYRKVRNDLTVVPYFTKISCLDKDKVFS